MPMKGTGSYTEPYKIPRGYDAETDREEIAWTEVSILADYRVGFIQHRTAIGILYGTG